MSDDNIIAGTAAPSTIAGGTEMVSNGFIYGWACRIDSPKKRIRVGVRVGDVVVAAGVADLFREDVKNHLGFDGLHGFKLFIRKFPQEIGKSCLFDIETGNVIKDGGPPIGPRTDAEQELPSIDSDFIRTGEAERLVDGYIFGWAWDPMDPARPLILEAWAGETIIGRGVARLSRPDIAKHLTSDLEGRHGYRIRIFDLPSVAGSWPIQIRDSADGFLIGTSSVSVFVGGESETLFASDVCDTDVTGTRRGVIEREDSGFIIGWTCDLTALEKPMLIKIEAFGTQIGRGVANLPRPDLAKALGSSGNHGYRIPISNLPSIPGRYSLQLIDCEDGEPIGDPTHSIIYDGRKFHCEGYQEKRDSFSEAAIDKIVVVGNGVLLQGWIADPSNNLNSVSLNSRAGVLSQDILSLSVRTQRPDVQVSYKDRGAVPINNGLVAYLPFGEVSDFLGNAFSLRARKKTKGGILRYCQNITRPQVEAEAVKLILEIWNIEDPSAAELFHRAINPALKDVQEDKRWKVIGTESVTGELSFGQGVKNPKLSLVIPVYSQADFLLYQNACFSTDKAFKDIELLYLCDDPRLHVQVRRIAAEAFECYKIPMRVIFSQNILSNGGKWNMGVMLSKAEYIIILGSEVLPTKPGWTDTLFRRLSTFPDAGIIGVRLLIGDGSLKHDGLSFIKSNSRMPLYFPECPGNGLPPTSNSEFVRTQGVSGSCIAFSKSVYQDVGGFSEEYLDHEFDDADFSLRVMKAGKFCYVDRSVCLKNLVFPASLQLSHEISTKLRFANAIRFNEKWSAFISSNSGETL